MLKTGRREEEREVDKKAVAAAVAVTVIMGLTFLASSELLIHANSFECAAIRWTFALVSMLALMALGLVKIHFKGKQWRKAAPVALCQPCIYAVCELEGIRMTTVAESAVILALVPIAVALISAIFFKVKISKIVGTSIVVSFIGVLMTIDYSEGFGGQTIGILILFAAVITGAMYSITSERASGFFEANDLAFVQCIAGGIFYNIVVLLRGEWTETYSIMVHHPTVILAGLYLGLICSAIGYILWNYVLSRIPAHISSVFIANGITLIGIWIGIFFRGEHISSMAVIGMVLIIAGVVGVSRGRRSPDD